MAINEKTGNKSNTNKTRILVFISVLVAQGMILSFMSSEYNTSSHLIHLNAGMFSSIKVKFLLLFL